jgi:hypothetical protein
VYVKRWESKEGRAGYALSAAYKGVNALLMQEGAPDFRIEQVTGKVAYTGDGQE